jgi:hypothetical protein
VLVHQNPLGKLPSGLVLQTVAQHQRNQAGGYYPPPGL